MHCMAVAVMIPFMVVAVTMTGRILPQERKPLDQTFSTPHLGDSMVERGMTFLTVVMGMTILTVEMGMTPLRVVLGMTSLRVVLAMII